MNIYEDLNNQIEKFLEGEVIPFPNKADELTKDVFADVEQTKKELEDVPDIDAGEGLALAKDYSNNGKKLGADVELGDILVQTFFYGSTQHYFYKVIERKPSSIKLAMLKKSTKLMNDDDGRVVPLDIVVPCDAVDGKIFRIFKPKVDWGKDIVCKLQDKALYYWDGKPKHETYMD